MFTHKKKKNFAPYCQNYCWCTVQQLKLLKKKTSILYKSVINDVGASHYFMYLI